MTDFAADLANAERAQLITDLKAARAELVKRGRCTGELVNDDGQVCAAGAILAATVEGFEELGDSSLWFALDREPRPRRALEVLAALVPETRWSRDNLTYFNDNDATDQDVLDLYDKALADLGGLA